MALADLPAYVDFDSTGCSKGRKSEVGMMKSEVGWTKSEVGWTKSEVGWTKSEVGQTKAWIHLRLKGFNGWVLI